MEKRALIFGGRTGLLGQALTRTLLAHQWNISCVGRKDGDILDANFIEKSIQKFRPTHVFNAIAWTNVDLAESEERDAYVLNRALPACLAQVVKPSSIHLIHYSTDFVFSGNKKNCYVEDDSPDPISVYGLSKLAGEQAILSLAPENSCILRTAWLFGPGRSNFVSKILDACHEKDHISVVHDQIGSPTYSMDLAFWSMHVAEKKLTGVYHAVNEGRASWCDLACEAQSLTEAPCRINPISSDEWPQKAKRPAFSTLNNTKLAEAIGITPRPWPQALRDYIFSEYLNRDTIGA